MKVSHRNVANIKENINDCLIMSSFLQKNLFIYLIGVEFDKNRRYF